MAAILIWLNIVQKVHFLIFAFCEICVAYVRFLMQSGRNKDKQVDNDSVDVAKLMDKNETTTEYNVEDIDLNAWSSECAINLLVVHLDTIGERGTLYAFTFVKPTD
jgi:hypothetical protein